MTRNDNFLRRIVNYFKNPLYELDDKWIIIYIFTKIYEDVFNNKPYLMAKYLIRSKYKGLSERELEEEERRLSYRKKALENANIENISIIFISVLGILTAILIGILQIFDIKDVVIKFTVLVYIFLVFLVVFYFAYRAEQRIKTKAKDIVYCKLCLEVINEMKNGKFEHEHDGENLSAQNEKET